MQLSFSSRIPDSKATYFQAATWNEPPTHKKTASLIFGDQSKLVMEPLPILDGASDGVRVMLQRYVARELSEQQFWKEAIAATDTLISRLDAAIDQAYAIDLKLAQRNARFRLNSTLVLVALLPEFEAQRATTYMAGAVDVCLFVGIVTELGAVMKEVVEQKISYQRIAPLLLKTKHLRKELQQRQVLLIEVERQLDGNSNREVIMAHLR